jgi:purine-binding chemotaxis protein CheW
MRLHRHRHDPSKSLVGFFVGSVSYAVPIACVREICRPLPTVPLPHAPPAVLGVAEYRGSVIVVIDMRVRFGLPALPATRKTKWVVISVEGVVAAIAVDAVTDVFGTAGAKLAAAPPPGAGGRGHIVGVTTHDDHMVFVIDVGQLKEDVAPVATRSVNPSEALMLQKGSS